MKRLAFALAALALAAGPALADPAAPATPPAAPAAPPNDTLTAILAHGELQLDLGGMSFDLTFKPDGTFTGGEFAGAYKVDGDKLCITIAGVVDNQCTAYPAGKKSGDSFTIQGDMGPYTVTIH